MRQAITRFALIVIGVVPAGLVGCGETSTPGTACTHAVECAAGTVCIGGGCIAETACTSSRMCPDLVCSTSRSVCVECNVTADCDPGRECESGVCITPPPPCTSDRDCSAMGLVCDTTRGVCAECNRARVNKRRLDLI